MTTATAVYSTQDGRRMLTGMLFFHFYILKLKQSFALGIVVSRPAQRIPHRRKDRGEGNQGASGQYWECACSCNQLAPARQIKPLRSKDIYDHSGLQDD